MYYNDKLNLSPSFMYVCVCVSVCVCTHKSTRSTARGVQASYELLEELHLNLLLPHQKSTHSSEIKLYRLTSG